MTCCRFFASSALAVCIAMAAFATPALAAPAADNFADAGALGNTRGESFTYLFDATRETGEPTVPGSNTAHTMWWRYTPAATGYVKFSTCSSSLVVPGLSLGLYTGSGVSTLTTIGQATGNCPAGTSNAVLGPVAVTAGVNYMLQIGSSDSVTNGNSTLRLLLDFNTVVPPNDAWAAATTVSTTLPQTFAADNGLATIQAGEPDSDATSQLNTLWYKWSAPATGVIAVDTCSSAGDSGEDSMIAAYTASSPSVITDLSFVDNKDGGCPDSYLGLDKLYLNVTGGEDYWIKLSNYSADYGFPYVLQFRWITTPDFSKRPSFTPTAPMTGNALTGSRGTWKAYPAGISYGYQWLRCDASGSGCTDIASATALNYTTTAADNGHTLRLRVTATNGAGSAFADSAPSALVDSTPPNDDFANATDLGTGSTISHPDDNHFATTESLEPGIGVNSPMQSVWYKWTPATPGDYGVNVCLGGSDFPDITDLMIGVRSGAGPIDTLALEVSADDGCGNYHSARTSLLLSATAGKTYWIQVAGKSILDTDSFTLSIKPAGPPEFTVDPSLSGTAAVNESLTFDLGDWITQSLTSTEVHWYKCDAAGAVCNDNGQSGTLFTIPSDYGGGRVKASIKVTNPFGSTTKEVLSALIPADRDSDGVLDNADTCPDEAGTGRPNGCPPSTITANSVPLLTGTMVTGQTISTSNGLWDVAGDPLPLGYDHKWQRCTSTAPASCSYIAGQTASSYTLTGADATYHIRSEVTASNTDDSAVQFSDIGVQVTAPPPAPSNTAIPAITGTPIVGEVLQSDGGSWTPAGTDQSYEWLRCSTTDIASCVAIGGYTDPDYQLQNDDLGTYIRSRVTATNITDSAIATSDPTAVITGDTDGDGVADVNDDCPGQAGDGRPTGCPPSVLTPNTTPFIIGTPEVGTVSSLIDGLWDVSGDPIGYDLSNQWQRCATASELSCVDIPGATADSYLVANADYGQRLRVVQEASNADDVDTQYSPLTGPTEQGPANVSLPTLSGAAIEGGQLATTDGDWVPFDTGFTYEWLRCTDNVSSVSCTAIPGATDPAHMLVAADVGSYIRSRVTGTNAFGSAFAESDASALVTVDPDSDDDGVDDIDDACPADFGTKPNGCMPADIEPDSPPVISGSLIVGDLLTSTDGTWTQTGDPLARDYAHQWERCNTSSGSCSDISGATSSTYTLAAADYGKYVRVKVTASNSDDSAFQHSAITATPVSQHPSAITAPTIGGSAIEGATLTSTQGTWSPVDASLANAWLRCDDATIGSCSAIGGEVGATYTTGGADVGKYIRLRVSGTTTASTADSTSSAIGPVDADADGDAVGDSVDACLGENGSKPNGCDPSDVVAATPPVISGTLEVGSTLSTTNGTFNVFHDNLPLTYSHRWQRCDTALAASCSDTPETDSTYLLGAADYGKYVRVRVTATNADDSDSHYSPIEGPVSQVPSNDVLPSVTGTATVGQNLTGDQGTWTPFDATLDNAWMRCDDATPGSCLAIGGETGPTYTLTAADEGKRIRLRVTASTTAGGDFKYSAPTAAVIVDADGDGVDDSVDACLGENGSKPNGCDPSDVVAATPPVISGTLEVGSTLSTTNGTFNVLHDNLPLTYSYQWQRCTSSSSSSCSDIAGADTSTRALAAADYGNRTRVRVTATNTDDSDQHFSDISNEIWQQPSNDTAPSVSGVSGVGDLLTADQGVWTPAAAALTTEWLRCDDGSDTLSCSVIAGETGPTYLTTIADLHKYIRIRVTATTPIGNDDVTSAATPEIVADFDGDGVDDIDDTCPADAGSKPNGCDPSQIVNTGAPVISGALTVGQTLSTTNGTWDVLYDPLGYWVTYQWQSCTTSDSSSCSDLGGHTASSYTLGSGEYGKYMRVVVTAHNDDDTTEMASDVTAMVSDVPTYSSPPSITGESRVSVELVGDRGIWEPADTAFEYQWLRCSDAGDTGTCSPISGETASFYTLQPADDGFYIRFQVKAETTSGTAVVDSAATDVVFTDTDEDGVHDADDNCPSVPGSKPNGCEPSEIFNVSLPVVTGTLVAGDTLSVSDGVWNVTGEQLGYVPSYEWLICSDTTLASCNGVSGETSNNFTIPTGVFGNYVRARVIASNADDTTDAYSDPVGPTDEDPYTIFDPAISGTTDVGSTLSGYDGQYGPSNVGTDRVWLRCDDAGMLSCAPIGGATAGTYTLQAADHNKFVVLRVHVFNGVGDLFAFSPVTAQIGAGILDSDGDGVLNADDACPSDAGDGRPNGCPPSDIVYVSDPSITGNLLVGDSLTAVAGGWNVNGDQLSLNYDYAWDVCATSNPITCSTTGQTGMVLPLIGAYYHQYIRVTETVSNADDVESATSTIIGPVEQAPTNSALPTISGITAENQLLTATSGTWDPGDVALDYSWLRCDDTTLSNCVTIGGETSPTFTPSAADLGKYIRVRVTGTTTADTLTVESAPAGPITAAPVDTDGDGVFDGTDLCPTDPGDGRPNGCPPSDIENASAPTLSGTFNVGQAISTTNGTWTVTGDQLPYNYTYSWQRCDTTDPLTCSTISGETGSTYTLTAADYGKRVRSLVKAETADDSAETPSAISAIVSQIPVNDTLPTISGSPLVGQTLTGSQGTWTPADAGLGNQWMSCSDNVSTASCSPISGETGTTYILVAADDASYIRLRVRATTTAGPTTAYSNPTALVTTTPVDSDGDGVVDGADACPAAAGDGRPNGCPPSDLSGAGNPALSGSFEVGQTISTTDGAWNETGDQLGHTISRQWQRCDTTDPLSCSDIALATGTTYTLTGSDYGKRIRSAITASNTDDTATQWSAISAVVSQVPVNNTAPSVSGTAQVGSTLTGTQGTWTPGDAALTNAWLRCTDLTLGSCTPIGGQSGTTYTLAAADLTNYIRFEVTATTTAGNDKLTTAPIGPVVQPDADGDGVPDASDACPAAAGDGRANGCPPSVLTTSTAPVISGTLQSGSTLSSSAGTWTITGDQLAITRAYQWQSCDDATTASCADIPSATSSSYTLTTSEIGKHIRVIVTASNADDSDANPSSVTATAVVQAPAPVNQTLPDVSGIAQVGQLLSTGGGDWTPAETVRTYEWLRCDDATLASCTPITGATLPAYELTAADLGKFMRVRVTGWANAQTSVAVSDPTSQVAQAPAGGGPTTPAPEPTNPATILGPKKGRVITVRVDKKGRIYVSRVSVYCTMQSTGDCSGEVGLKARVGGKLRTIGGFKLNTLRGGGRTLRIKLSSAALKHLRQHATLSADLKVTYKSPGVSTSRYSAKLKIKRR